VVLYSPSTYTALGDACPNLSILDLAVGLIAECQNHVLSLVLGRRRASVNGHAFDIVALNATVHR
jgi:hypothetical protein